MHGTFWGLSSIAVVAAVLFYSLPYRLVWLQVVTDAYVCTVLSLLTGTVESAIIPVVFGNVFELGRFVVIGPGISSALSDSDSTTVFPLN